MSDDEHSHKNSRSGDICLTEYYGGVYIIFIQCGDKHVTATS
jgi:hypothetical protein